MFDRFPRKRVGDIAAVKGGKRLPRGTSVQDKPTSHPYIRVTDFAEDRLDVSQVRYIDERIHRQISRYIISSDDVYISIAGTIGRVGIVPESLSGANLTENAAKICDIDPAVDKRFLMYSLRSYPVQARIDALTGGASQPKLALYKVKELEIPLPPLPTQRKIAAILSAYDDLIENNTRRITILEEMAQMVYREWFVHFRFPGHEDVAMVDSELGAIPEGWQVRRLGDVAERMRRGADPQDLAEDTPYIGLGHMPKKSIALREWGSASETKSRKYRFKTGEILFGRIRPYFHKVGVAPVDGVGSTDIIVIAPKNPEAFSLVLGCVSSERFVDYATQTSSGTKMPRAKWKILVDYPVIIPPDPILRRHNALIEDIVAHITNSIFRNRILRQARDFLLPRLVSGELDVGDVAIDVTSREA